MPTSERFGRARRVLAIVAALSASSLALADPAPYRYSAPIAISAQAPFVQIALPPAA